MSKRKETVKRVIDGDTFTTKSRSKPVRLANVDAPEKNSRKGAQSTQFLRGLIQGQTVEVDTVARDVYGRTVANVKVNGKSVNNAVKNNLKK